MSGGILGGGYPQGAGILGGSPQPAGMGILDRVGQAFADNAGMLMGYGSGGFDGAMQGMQQDERTRLIKQKQAEEEQKKVAAQQIAQKMGLPEGFASSPDDVFALARTVQAQKLTPREPTEFERLTAGMDKETVERAKLAKLGLSQSEGWKAVEVNDGAGGKRTLFQRGNQFATPEQLGIPGGSTKATQQEEQRQQAASIVVQDIDRALETIGQSDLTIGGYDTGINTATGRTGQVLSMVGGTNAHNVSALTDTIKANATFDKLQQMRQSSPTGAALGSVTDTDMKLLGAAIGSLENSQGKEQFQQNLVRVKKIYSEVIHGKGNVDDMGNPIRGAKQAVQGGPDRSALEAEARRRGLKF